MNLVLSKKEQSVLKKFRNTLEKTIGNNLVEMKLFGSKAQGTSKTSAKRKFSSA